LGHVRARPAWRLQRPLAHARRAHRGGPDHRGRGVLGGALGSGSAMTEVLPLRVLVVDDSSTARLLITEALSASGKRRERLLRISEASDGFEALRQLPRGSFDLVLTDINMPTLSGLELIRMIRARPEHKNLPIVAISTEREPEDARRAREAGA